MTQTAKYWLTLAFLFLAFGYTADGYQTAAYLFSIFAVLAAIDAHSFRSIYRKRIPILFYGTLVILLCVGTGLSEQMPAIWFVSFCSCTSCILFEESSVKTMKNTVFAMFLVMSALYLFTLIVPYTVYGQKDTLLLISTAFLPIELTYFHKVFLIDMKKSKVKMTTTPQMY